MTDIDDFFVEDELLEKIEELNILLRAYRRTVRSIEETSKSLSFYKSLASKQSTEIKKLTASRDSWKERYLAKTRKPINVMAAQNAIGVEVAENE